jgi:outer membrane protein OmpA-like peptidoglycan-associated protein/opacity protein-like surface antigen
MNELLQVERRRRPAGWWALMAAAAWSLLTAATPLEHAGSMEVGLFAGYHLISDDSELGNAPYSDNILESGIVFGGRFGYNLNNMLGVEAEARYQPTSFKRGGDASSILAPRAHGLIHFGLMQQRLRPFVLVGAGSEMLLSGKDNKANDPNDWAEADQDFAWHLGVGAKYHVLDNLLLRLDARYINAAGRDALTAHNMEVLLGVSWWIEGVPADTDADGNPDKTDKCPEQAEDKDGFEDADGCPDPDNDGDGVLDAADKCPDEAEDKDGHQDTDGCPDPDNDGDGVPDSKDKCRDQAEDKDAFQDEDGCPDPDNDGDGVLDGDDKCPTEAGVKEEQGCPVKDKDGDGIPDKADKCPDKAETFNGVDDEDGCPDKKSLVVITETEVKILQKVNFETGKAAIKSDSFGLLDTVALVLNKQPAVTKILIEGHTDDVGKDEDNLKLSDDRAQSVMRYLVERGVAAARLDARGFGESVPLCAEVAQLTSTPKLARKNKKAIATCREQNRRVQFKILELNGKPVGATESITIKEKKEVEVK